VADTTFHRLNVFLVIETIWCSFLPRMVFITSATLLNMINDYNVILAILFSLF